MKHPSVLPSLAAHFCLVLTAAASGCVAPSDVVFEPPLVTPIESDGRYRVTFNPNADVARGFTPEGWLVFRARGLTPFSDGWILASVPPRGGVVREEVSLYRQSVRAEVGALAFRDERRVLAVWVPAVESLDGCGPPAPDPPPVVSLTLYELPPADGVPLAALASRVIPGRVVSGAGSTSQRVRVTPAQREIRDRGVNPFGPVLLPDSAVLYSDGEFLWTVSLTDPAATPALLGPGTFPALAPDGSLLAFARPTGVDSTVQTYVVPFVLGVCIQEHVEVTATGWEVVLLDLASFQETRVGEGLEPVFEPAGSHLVVRRVDALYRVALAGLAATRIPGSDGAFAPFIPSDGTVLAFSRTVAGNTDVYFVNAGAPNGQQ